MKTYHEAYEEPAVDVLGTAGREIAAYRFCRDLVRFATGHTAGYLPADTARRLAELDRMQGRSILRNQGSPFTTITGPAGTTTGQSR